MPSYRGLYAAALPPIAAALFASSPYLQTGPVAVTSLLTFGALSVLAPPGSDEYVRLGIGLALLVGVARLVVGLLGAGVIAYLVSQPVLLGFVPAAAILIVSSQLPSAVGADPRDGGILRRAASTLADPGGWAAAPGLLAAGAITLMLAGRLVHRLFPSVLLAVAAGLALSRAGVYDGATIGPIPEGLPPFSLAMPWGDLPALVLAALVIALVGFVEPSSIARTFSAQERRPWDPNREFVSQGAANVAAAVSGGFPVGGSFSRSALNRLAGAKTRWSGAVAGLAVLAFLPVANQLAPLPTAVLAAIVIAAVLPLIRLSPLVRLAGLSRPQFLVASATFALTLALAPHIETAIVVGIGLAAAVHLWRELRLEVGSWQEDGVLHLRPRGVLWFGSAARLEDTFLERLAARREATRLLVHLDGLGRIDITGALALRSLLQEAQAAGLAVEIVDVRPRWRGLVDRVIAQEHDPLRRGSARRPGAPHKPALTVRGLADGGLAGPGDDPGETRGGTMGPTALIEMLAERGTDYELLPHRRAETAAAEARALGVPPEQTAKTVIVRTPDGYARVVVPASRRVDLARLRTVLGVDEVALVTEAELVAAYPHFELGAVPPFDGTCEDEVIVDRHLCAVDHVVFEAGTHEQSIRLRTSDLIELANARLAEICEH